MPISYLPGLGRGEGRMGKTKISFLAKSAKLKLVMVCAWLWVLLKIFEDVSRPLDFYDIGSRAFWGLFAGLPVLLYFFSGKRVTLDFVKKTVWQNLVLMNVPIGRPKRAVPVCEVFLLPEVLTYMSQYSSEEVAYSLCAGEFARPEKPEEEEGPGGGSGPKRGMGGRRASRLSGRKPSYFALKHDMMSFKKAESLMRGLAKRLEAPARVYWGEIKPGAAAASKAGAGLEEPFELPAFAQDMEKSPLARALEERAKKQNSSPSAESQAGGPPKKAS